MRVQRDRHEEVDDPALDHQVSIVECLCWVLGVQHSPEIDRDSQAASFLLEAIDLGDLAVPDALEVERDCRTDR